MAGTRLQARVPAGDWAGVTRQAGAGPRLAPIRNRSACARPPRPLVNIPVICKQTEFTSDYEWIHQILMELPCRASPRVPNASPPWYNVHLNTWIANKEGPSLFVGGNVDWIFKRCYFDLTRLLAHQSSWWVGGGVGEIWDSQRKRQKIIRGGLCLGKGLDKQQWEKEDGDKRQSAGKGWNHHIDCHGDRQYRKRGAGVGGQRYRNRQINRSGDDRLTVTTLHKKT